MFFDHHSRLLVLKEKHQSRIFTAGDFTRLIRGQFPATDFSFCTRRDYAVDPDMIIVAGSYDSYYDRQRLPHTEITLCYHPEQKQYLGSRLNWEQISFDVAECIGHELVHRTQYKTKKPLAKYISHSSDIEKKYEQEYLGGDDEIEAYGFSIAVEAKTFDKEYRSCTMYTIYENVFDNDHLVIVKLEQQIVKYLIQLNGVQQ